MTKRTITTLPSLDVTAFLFPNREFKHNQVSSLRFRTRMENSQVVVEYRRVGHGTWALAEPAFADDIRWYQNNPKKTHRHYEFVVPVKIEDDPRTSED